jgi:threonine/homoserine/homoserine lactone efflux protein
VQSDVGVAEESDYAMNEVVAFAALALLLTLTPGPDTFLVLRSSLSGGIPAGLATAAGILLGLVLWAVAAATGIAAILVASQEAFRLLQIVGGVYLCWLGARSLISALRSRRQSFTLPRSERTATASFRVGLVSNLTNPKVGAFYLSVLPPFIPSGGSLLWPVALSLIHLAESAAWLGLIVIAAVRLRSLRSSSPVQRALEAFAGVSLLAFGAIVLAGGRRR